jgi:F-type H+-transporting ATPase subunit epsilon
MKFELITPARQLADLEGEYISLPGESGDFGVLPGHMPLISTLRDGATVEVRDAQGHLHRFTTTGGLADVHPTHVTLLAASAEAI